MIKTIDDACQFVLEQKVVTVFGSKNSPYQSLWDNTGFSEKKPKAGGWSPTVKAVWDWKTRIPQTYPHSVFYGKVPGGDAVLMEMQHFRHVHYVSAFQPVGELDSLAQGVYDLIRLEPAYTGPLRMPILFLDHLNNPGRKYSSSCFLLQRCVSRIYRAATCSPCLNVDFAECGDA